MPQLPENIYDQLVSCAQKHHFNTPTMIKRFLTIDEEFEILNPQWEEKQRRMIERDKRRIQPPRSKICNAFRDYLCFNCGGKIEKGTHFYWNVDEHGKVFYTCFDCGEGLDKDIAKKVVQIKRLKKQKKALKKEIDCFIDIYEKGKYSGEWSKRQDELQRLIDKWNLYINQMGSYTSEEEQERAEELVKYAKQILIHDQDFETFYQTLFSQVTTKKNRKNKKSTYRI